MGGGSLKERKDVKNRRRRGYIRESSSGNREGVRGKRKKGVARNRKRQEKRGKSGRPGEEGGSLCSNRTNTKERTKQKNECTRKKERTTVNRSNTAKKE